MLILINFGVNYCSKAINILSSAEHKDILKHGLAFYVYTMKLKGFKNNTVFSCMRFLSNDLLLYST